MWEKYIELDEYIVKIQNSENEEKSYRVQEKMKSHESPLLP